MKLPMRSCTRSPLSVFSIVAALFFTLSASSQTIEAPRLAQKDGRYALLVEGRPFLILGGQIHNSSAWPSELPQVWESLETLHANTVEAPVYWEQFERQPGAFDFTNVDQIVSGARAHHLHVVLAWFGTWKNGNMHYAPAWVKSDPIRFTRVLRPDGEPIDVLSPLSQSTLEADKAAFKALMHHLKQIDSEEHTVLLVQVENEAGNLGSVRDNSAQANKEFAAQVPAELLAVTHQQPGSWSHVFGSEADETFQVYYQAKYIDQIAAAGKAEFNIPMYINVWVDSPAEELPQRQMDTPGIAYPSGGAIQKFVGLWRALAPSIDLIGPDLYSDDSQFYQKTMRAYRRPDNPLFIPETGRDDTFGKFFFYALGDGAIGFSPFGIDRTGWNILGDQPFKTHANNFALVGPMSREVAQLEFDGQLQTAVEELGQPTREVDFGDWQATVAFGFPQSDGRTPPGTKDAHAVALIARLGPNEFLVTGVDASVSFHLPGKLPWIRSEIVSAEQGTYGNGVWNPLRLWNGDESNRGLCFYQKLEILHVRLEKF
jgi:hypothetical protein